MAMTGNRFLRRLARLLVGLQLLAFAAAPIFEAFSVAASGRSVPSVEVTQSGGSGLVHDPASCPACQLLRISARPVAVAPVSFVGERRTLSVDWADEQAPAPVARQGYSSRAPPLDLV
jgi:hypothetical protein